ncbi:DUF4124 domain-containing protein [Marinobacterium rhizophilum]|uniref:DUF4124 domain-containing protein n=1 Tax=Marinobacterium rhizophilum TaxID=420402 RepID=A0ABY5HKM7_9GAMM|nr:DUF4124 domain-containing protein [Marinobacterium rhizophilum]UTW11511.1 DUF4124 domain-containing protein [Marinobacterium rhizophilum]
MPRCSLALVLMLFLASQVQAGVYKCEGPDGRISFSGKPCAQEKRQLEHRLSAEERRLAEDAEEAEAQRRQAETAEAPQDAYSRLMQRLAGQVYRRAGPVAEPDTALQPEPVPGTVPEVDNLVEGLVHRMEQGLTFEVEPGSSFDPVSNSPGDASVQQVAAYLAANLYNPASLEVIEWGPVLKVVQFNPQDFSSWKEYRVRLRFQAKNGLGHFVPLDQVFIISSDASVQRVTDFDGRPLQDY